jgi:outer membrane usher protein
MSLAGQRMLLAAFGAMMILGTCMHPFFIEPAYGNGAGAAVNASGDTANGMTLTMPVKDHGFKLSDVIVLASADGAIHLQRQSFLNAIRPVFRDQAWQALDAGLPKSEYVSLEQVAAAGLISAYNSENLEITIEPRVEQRPRGEIRGTLGGRGAPADVEQPAAFSGFLNMYAGIGYERYAGAPGTFEIPALLFDGATRWNNFVLEGEAQVDADGQFARRHTRLVYDFPDKAIRVSAGDISLRPYGSFSMPPLLGVAIERSYSELQPTRNIRPTGKRSFRIERHSEVQVIANGREVRRLRLSPGEYDLDDLPLSSGTNDIKLKITDEFGKEEFVDFAILFNRTLLEPGMSEWSVSGGLKAQAGSDEPSYDAEIPILSGLYRRGLSETLTGSISGQASADTGLFGFNALTQLAYGLLSFDTAASITVNGDLGWSFGGDFEIDTDQLWDEIGALSFGIEVEGSDFVSSLEQMPADAMRMRISGSLSQPLPAGLTGNISGYFQLSEAETDNGFGTSISVNRVVSNDLTISLSGSYEERGQSDNGDRGKVSLLARLNYRPSRESYLTIQYDGTSKKTTGAAGTNFAEGSWRTSFDVELENLPQIDGGETERLASTDLFYSDSRIEVNASHSRSFKRLGNDLNSKRTLVNVGTAVAFADGNIAVGRPVRGGFAIVSPHKSLENSQVKLDTFQDKHRAESDGLGPLLVSDISAYAPSSVPYDVDDLPLGYDIGTGSFNFVAPYKAGYSLTIGSDFAVTAMGTLEDVEGKPVALKAMLISMDGQSAKKIQSFTNGAGRFTAQGLKAGAWTIELNDAPSIRYSVNVPEDATGFFELGALKPQSE